MAASMTLPVTARWIIGEPSEHPISASEQGFDDWYSDADASILRYRGGFEIIELQQISSPGFIVPWMGHHYTTRDREDAELWLAEQIVRDGSITGLTL